VEKQDPTRGHPDRPSRIIDMHAHIGAHQIHSWMSDASVEKLLRRASRTGIDLTVASHLDALYHAAERLDAANRELLAAAEKTPNLFVWWIVDPRQDQSLKSLRALKGHPKIVGFKVGPTYHGYYFRDHAHEIMGLALELRLPVLSHCGQEHDMPADLVAVADRYPEVTLILAHFGNCENTYGHEKALLRAKSQRVFVDTSSQVSIFSGLLERGVKALDDRKFFFGTDSMLYSAAAQLWRVLESDLPAESKKRVLGENAWNVLFDGRKDLRID
jgi:uncharacterized protein